ncbi:MAG: GTPase, partial [Phormidesmis sp. CAN_BIN44]|nr:GTPase [Phormidesmis sp. CAN_BIN44]
DVVCYVVTNDSIQETEFKFLEILKKKAKPLIVLLNVHYNLRDSRRLENFLKNPDSFFAKEGQSGLGGHIERIKRYARQHYSNDCFPPIVPAMLIAAQLAYEPAHQLQQKQLLAASKLQDFLDSIRISLIQNGAIRRSQTLLGSTVGSINQPLRWVGEQVNVYAQLTQTLKSKHETTKQTVGTARKDTREQLKQQIKCIFQDAINAVPTFAEDHWDVNEAEMKRGWEKELKTQRFEERLKVASEEASQKFKQEVQTALEEVGNELQLISQLGSDGFNFQQQDANTFDRTAFKIGGLLIGVAAAVIPFFGVPVLAAVAIGLVGTALGWFSSQFKSKEQKRREAVNNISSSLKSQLEKHLDTTLQQVESNFSSSCAKVATVIDHYFDELIQGLGAIAKHLEIAEGKLKDSENYLNRAYAKRIVDWSLDQYRPLTEASINQSIARVSRDFGSLMMIQTKTEIKPQKSQAEMREVLQENVSIQFVKS